MSLLIKALQKAEQSKHEAAGQTASPVPDSALELAPHHAQQASNLREESGFEPAPPRPPQAAIHARRQAAAASILQVNEPPYVIPPSTWKLAGGGLLLLLALGGSFYFYLDSLNQPSFVASRPASPLPAPRPKPPVLEAPAPVAVLAPAVEAPAPVRNMASSPKPLDVPTAVLPPEREVADVREPKPKTQAAPEAAVKITRSRVPSAAVNDQVLSGYQAYMAGDDAAAARYYRQAAQSEPRNVDAWLGLAAVAARQGKTDDAATHYLRVLELEPRNVAAQTGIIGLMGQADPAASEGRLKSLLAQQPEAAFLHAALGNLYADQGQWISAQQAYFQAFHFDASNAEYAFNLAVSLDQMGKPDLALNHYQRALELLPKSGGTVDRGQLEARIAQLKLSSGK